MRILPAFAVGLCLAAAPAAAQTPEAPVAPAAGDSISGRAVALDGDTLLMGGRRVRLFGIDAPEMRGARGPRARAVLDDLIAGATLTCQVLDRDRHKRQVVLCAARGVGAGRPRATIDTAEPDLGAAMIRLGQAVPYRIYSHGAKAPAGLAAAYDAAERAARAGGLGIWAREGSAGGGGFWRNWRLWQIAAAFLGFFLAASLKFAFDLILDAKRRDKETAALIESLASEMDAIAAGARKFAAVLLDLQGPHPPHHFLAFVPPRLTIFEANADKIGWIPDDQRGPVLAAVIQRETVSATIKAVIAHPLDAGFNVDFCRDMALPFETLARLSDDAAKALKGTSEP